MLGQACAHCPKSLTAASRRSRGRVSVPVWPAILSDRLPIAGLVGRHPANYLIGRGPLHRRIAALPPGPNPGPHAVLAPLSGGYPPPVGRSPTCYSAVRHWGPKPPVRLACFRHAASVDPEPGSNSPSLIPRPTAPAGAPGHESLTGPSPHHSPPVNVPRPAGASTASRHGLRSIPCPRNELRPLAGPIEDTCSGATEQKPQAPKAAWVKICVPALAGQTPASSAPPIVLSSCRGSFLRPPEAGPSRSARFTIAPDRPACQTSARTPQGLFTR